MKNLLALCLKKRPIIFKSFIKKVPKSARLIIILGCVAIVLFSLLWRYESTHPNTTDAYVQAHIVYVSPQVTGAVSSVFVHNYEQVSMGQTLFEINPQPYKYELAQAVANLAVSKEQVDLTQAKIAAAKATIDKARANYEVAKAHEQRISSLLATKAVSQQTADQARGAEAEAKAQVDAAEDKLVSAQQSLVVDQSQIRVSESKLEQAKLNLSYTKVTAPVSGMIVKFKLNRGAVINANQPQFAIINTRYWWVDANFKETDLSHMKVGQRVKVSVDMYPDHVFYGVVSAISRGSGSEFALLPPENASGNWVKVTQRFPVRIALKLSPADKAFPLRAGATAEVTVFEP